MVKTSERDPVCGMPVAADHSLAVQRGETRVHFCSVYCRDEFLARPERYRGAPAESEAPRDPAVRRIAYFSMEVAVQGNMPTYSGGLGVLAGDMLKSCADLAIPVVAVSLLYRGGYFDQTLDASGRQHEAAVRWEVDGLLQPLAPTIAVEIDRRTVRVRAWQYTVGGLNGYEVPLVLLGTDMEGNTLEDRSLVHRLYDGDQAYRLAQEMLLGIGGVKMLQALGYTGLRKYHMNEGHASLLALALLDQGASTNRQAPDFHAVRERCIFTTHTPVPAGHDQFDYELLQRMLPQDVPMSLLRMLGGPERLNMTVLGLNLSRYVNGVARRHGEVTREMFPDYPIHHITNGVHSSTWTCDSFKLLFDAWLPGWEGDPSMLRHAMGIPAPAIWESHTEAKARLLSLVRERSGAALDANTLTIGFARRATAYKRTDLVLSDISRLRQLARRGGPVQLLFAGKAHPKDEDGKNLIQHVVAVAGQLAGAVPIVYLENYDMDMAKLLVAGTDLWLNTPRRPLEASGTSGMKAAHNGVPSLSTLDGWWLEGHVEGVTGWSIGTLHEAPLSTDATDQADADHLYRKLEDDIVPMVYGSRHRWTEVMRHCIALNAGYFNTHRMVQQYASSAYLP